MGVIRRALLLSTGERYVSLLISFALIAVISRILTPSEVGISVIGASIMAVITAMREFVSPMVLIQRHELSREDIRTAATASIGMSAILALTVSVAARWFAEIYHEPTLEPYLHVVALASLIEAIGNPAITLLRRDLAFGVLGVVNIVAAVASSATCVGLAWSGHGAMSYAWAALVLSSVTTGMGIVATRDLRMLVPTLSSWRVVLEFGFYNGALTVVNKANEAVPQLVLGRVLPLQTVGLYNRAVLVAGLPDRLVLAGVFSMAFPAFAAEARTGKCLRPAFLTAVGHITAVYWPALALLSIMAYPVVGILLGDAWLAIVPLVQIMCLAGMFWFVGILVFPVLAAAGAPRDAFMATMISQPASLLILCAASLVSIEALALSQFITLPLQMIVGLVYIRRHVAFGWGELLAVLGRSAVILLASSVGPVVTSLWYGVQSEMTLLGMLIAGLSALVGWLFGLHATAHPMLGEMRILAEYFKAGRKAGSPSTAS